MSIRGMKKLAGSLSVERLGEVKECCQDVCNTACQKTTKINIIIFPSAGEHNWKANRKKLNLIKWSKARSGVEWEREREKMRRTNPFNHSKLFNNTKINISHFWQLMTLHAYESHSRVSFFLSTSSSLLVRFGMEKSNYGCRFQLKTQDIFIISHLLCVLRHLLFLYSSYRVFFWFKALHIAYIEFTTPKFSCAWLKGQFWAMREFIYASHLSCGSTRGGKGKRVWKCQAITGIFTFTEKKPSPLSIN